VKSLHREINEISLSTFSFWCLLCRYSCLLFCEAGLYCRGIDVCP